MLRPHFVISAGPESDLSAPRRQFPGARFLIQGGFNNASLLRLVLRPGIQLNYGGLLPRSYAKLLKSADIFLLPYAPKDYRARTSGNFADCAAHGKFAVVPDGTWMSKNTHGDNAAGLIFYPDSPSGAQGALTEALTHRDDLLRMARTRSLYWQKHQSAAAYIDRLMTDLRTPHNVNVHALIKPAQGRDVPAQTGHSPGIRTAERVR